MHTVTQELIDAGRRFDARGWVLGTSGNFSAVTSRDPLRLAITRSGAHKGALTPDDILEIDADTRVVAGRGTPSAETPLHLEVIASRNAGAVMHTHSIWSTLLSEGSAAGVAIEDYEMLKGLEGVRTHAHREWLPILENTQDWRAAGPRVESLLAAEPAAHGFLIRRHGLYTWGRDLAAAERHVEILEFLFEVLGRKRGS